MSRFEIPAYALAIAVLGGMLVMEGAHSTSLQSKVPVGAKELYDKLANSQVKIQIIDARDDMDEYEDVHIPGAIPFPGCDLSKTPDAARERILDSAPTIVVTENGADEMFQKCQSAFTTARNLAGGMTAWYDANLPEDSGEYSPPTSGAGGGCL